MTKRERTRLEDIDYSEDLSTEDEGIFSDCGIFHESFGDKQIDERSTFKLNNNCQIEDNDYLKNPSTEHEGSYNDCLIVYESFSDNLTEKRWTFNLNNRRGF